MTMNTPIGVVVTDDHPVYRDGLVRAIAERPDLRVAGEAADGAQTLERLREPGADLAVLDVRLPDMNGPEVFRTARNEGITTPVVFLSALEEPALIFIYRQTDLTVKDVHFRDYPYTGANCRESDDLMFLGNRLQNLNEALRFRRCRRVNASGNLIRDMKMHGIEFWGHHREYPQKKFTVMACEDLIFTNNYIYRGGGGAIWGAAARRVEPHPLQGPHHLPHHAPTLPSHPGARQLPLVEEADSFGGELKRLG